MGQFSPGVVPIGGEFDLPSLPLLGFSNSGLFSLNQGMGLSLAANIVYLQTLALWQVGPHALPSGVLTPLAGSPFATPAAGPRWPICDPSGKFLYYLTPGTNALYAFTVNPVTGALVAVAGSPFATGNSPNGLTISPNGRFLYVPNTLANTVSAYTINQATGALTPIAGSPFATGGAPTQAVINPSGTFLWITNQTGNSISAYSINATTGILTPVAGSPFASPNSPAGITIHPSGNFIFVSNYNGAAISSFVVNLTTGALTPAINSPYVSGAFPYIMVCDPLGRFLFAITNAGAGTVEVYVINSVTGQLTPAIGSPYAAGNTPAGLAIDPAGEILVVTNGLNQALSFLINDTTGILIPVVGSPFATGVAPTETIIDPTGKFCYVANLNGNSISAFSTSATIQLPLLEGTFDQSGANQNRLNINGQLMINGQPIAQGIPSSLGNQGRFLRVDSAGGTTTLWDNINNAVPVAMVANAGAFTVTDSGDMLIDITGALTAQGALTATILFPADPAKVVFDNATTGGFPLVLNGGFTVPPGRSIWYYNGVTFKLASARGFTTTQVTPLPNNGAALTANHLCGTVPSDTNLELVCLAAEGGYSIGDVVLDCYVAATGTGATPADLASWKNATQVGTFIAAGNNIWIQTKNTGLGFQPTLANWAYRFLIQP